MKQYSKKMIISGRFVELYEYEEKIAKGFEAKRKGRACVATAENAKINRGKVASRARAKITRVINANPQLNKFLTLTFAKNVTDLDEAQNAFKLFVMRLVYKYNSFQYVSVVEFQKRGAVHFHLLCNLPYVDVKKFAELWSNGSIKLNRLDDVHNVGSYVAKYITKDNIDDRLIGRRCYSMSRGLNKPVVVSDDFEVDKQLERIEGVQDVYTSEYVTEKNGVCHYTIIRLDKPFEPCLFMQRHNLEYVTSLDGYDNPFIRDKWLNVFKKIKERRESYVYQSEL